MSEWMFEIKKKKRNERLERKNKAFAKVAA